jgi:hypothetical protein
VVARIGHFPDVVGRVRRRACVIQTTGPTDPDQETTMSTLSIAHRCHTPHAVVAVVAAGAVTMSLSSNARASVDPIYHNARVAEYLLLQHLEISEHNARVAEYLLLQHLETSATTPSSAR